MLEAVGVLAVAAVLGTARGLYVGGVPVLGADGAQECGRVHGACTHFHVERLEDHAALAGPELLQAQDQFLEGLGGQRRCCCAHRMGVGAGPEGRQV